MGKALLEPIDIEAAYPLLATPDAAEEAHLTIVGEQIHRLVVEAFVDQIAVEILQLAHVQLILAPLQAAGQAGDALFEFGDTIYVRHSTLPIV